MEVSYDIDCQRFVLIRNSGVRILPEDTIDVTTFSDKLLLIDEPEGFDSARITLERDVWHGLNYEYSLDVLMFSCEFGKNYLAQIFLEDGTDADVKFVYGYGTEESLEVLHVGKLDFNEYTVENAEYVKSNMIKDDFGNVLQTAFDIPQEVTLDRDVLLYSKVIPKKVEYFINPLENQTQSTRRSANMTSFGGGFSSQTQDGFLFLNETKEGDSSLTIFPSYQFQLDNIEPSTASRLKFLFRAKDPALYQLKFRHRLELGVGFDQIQDWTTQVVKDTLKLNVFKTQADGSTKIGDTLEFDPEKIIILGIAGGGSGGKITLEFVADLTITMEFDECLYSFILFDSTGMPNSSNVTINSVASLPFGGDRTIPQIDIVGNTTANLSKSKLISPYNALNTIFKLGAEITDYDVVKSDFFQEGGCGSKLNITNGYNIRGVFDRLLTDSPKGLFEKFGNLFCLGWGIEYDDNNKEIIRIEPAEYFYKDNLLMTVDDISDYEMKVDPQAYYNEIETGFTKYSKQRETEKGNTLDDIHTKHIYQTPIKTNKSKLTIVSDIVLSGYELEFLRRKQFDKDGRNENASFNQDEDIFGVQLLSEDLFSGNSLSGEEIVSGQDNIIVLLGIDYYYFEGQGVTLNIDGQGSKSNVVQSIVYGEVTPLGFSEPFPATRITFNVNFDPFINVPTNRSVVISLIDNESYLVPESNQPFESISNLVSPQTGYNLRYTPKRMLLNWAKLFNGGFRTKDDLDTINFMQGDGNVSFSSKFRISEECLLGNDRRQEVKEDENITLIDTFTRDYLFLPYKVTFNCNLSFTQLNYIRKAMRGISSNLDNYGYLEYVSPSGAIEQIYVTKITFNPTELEAEIEGWLKDSTTFTPEIINPILDELGIPVQDEISRPIIYQ